MDDAFRLGQNETAIFIILFALLPVSLTQGVYKLKSENEENSEEKLYSVQNGNNGFP